MGTLRDVRQSEEITILGRIGESDPPMIVSNSNSSIQIRVNRVALSYGKDPEDATWGLYQISLTGKRILKNEKTGALATVRYWSTSDMPESVIALIAEYKPNR